MLKNHKKLEVSGIKFQKSPLILLSILIATNLLIMQGCTSTGQHPTSQQGPPDSSFADETKEPASTPPQSSEPANPLDTSSEPLPGSAEEIVQPSKKEKPIGGNDLKTPDFNGISEIQSLRKKTDKLTPEQKEEAIQISLERLATGAFFIKYLKT